MTRKPKGAHPLNQVRKSILQADPVGARHALTAYWSKPEAQDLPRLLEVLRASLDLAAILDWQPEAREWLAQTESLFKSQSTSSNLKLQLEALKARFQFSCFDLEAGQKFFKRNHRKLKTFTSRPPWLTHFQLAVLVSDSQIEQAKVHLRQHPLSFESSSYDRATRLLLIGSLQETEGRWELTEKTYRKALNKFSKIRSPEATYQKAICRLQIAHTLTHRGKSDLALDQLSLAHRAATKLWWSRLKRMVDRARIVVLRQEGLNLFENSAEVLKESTPDSPWVEALHLLNAAWFAGQGLKLTLAKKLLRHAQKLLQGNRTPFQVRALKSLVEAQLSLPRSDNPSKLTSKLQSTQKHLRQAQNILRRHRGGPKDLQIMLKLGWAHFALYSGDIVKSFDLATKCLKTTQSYRLESLEAESLLLQSTNLTRSRKSYPEIYQQISSRLLAIKDHEMSLKINANLYIYCFEGKSFDDLELQHFHMKVINDLQSSIPLSRYEEIKRVYLDEPMLSRIQF